MARPSEVVVGAKNGRRCATGHPRPSLQARQRDEFSCELLPSSNPYSPPVNFELSDEQKLIQSTVRDFARAEVAPVAEELDREKRFPYEIVEKLGGPWLIGNPFPSANWGSERREPRR